MRGWPEHNATGAAPRTLFIVGDAMQSIYGFRYADVALFLSARQGHFGGITLEPVTLSQNFRSRPEVVEWVNEVFAELMGAEDRPHHGSVRHVKAESLPCNLPSADAGVNVRLFEDGEGQSVLGPLRGEGELRILRVHGRDLHEPVCPARVRTQKHTRRA